MRTLLIGARGQLGTALAPLFDGELHAPSRGELDLADPPAAYRWVMGCRPDLVINAAAYNLVDRAEDEPQVAYAINALGPRALARACAELGCALVHVSTDHVFGIEPQRQTPYREEDAPGPVSAYGVSKLAGEYFVRAGCPRHFVVRTCGLYGVAASPGKSNFVETMLRKAREQNEITVVQDQRCTPTWAADLARAIWRLVATQQYGLYHATNSGQTSWYEFARTILEMARLDARVVPTSSAQYAARAARPKYSVLDGSLLFRAIGSALPDWRESLANYLNSRGAHAHG